MDKKINNSSNSSTAESGQPNRILVHPNNPQVYPRITLNITSLLLLNKQLKDWLQPIKTQGNAFSAWKTETNTKNQCSCRTVTQRKDRLHHAWTRDKVISNRWVSNSTCGPSRQTATNTCLNYITQRLRYPNTTTNPFMAYSKQCKSPLQGSKEGISSKGSLIKGTILSKRVTPIWHSKSSNLCCLQ